MDLLPRFPARSRQTGAQDICADGFPFGVATVNHCCREGEEKARAARRQCVLGGYKSRLDSHETRASESIADTVMSGVIAFKMIAFKGVAHKDVTREGVTFIAP